METTNSVENNLSTNEVVEEIVVTAENTVSTNEVIEETQEENIENSQKNNIEEIPLNIPQTVAETTGDPEGSPVVYTTNTVLIEEKLDHIIALESQQVSTSLIFIGLLAGGVVCYLLYKFIANFFEF